MPSQTAGYRLPYPLGTDRLMDGDDQIRKLAQSVENCVQSGTVTIPITAVNTQATVAVTFPVAYQAAPVVVAGWVAGTIAGSVGGLTLASVTTTGFTAAGIRTSGAAAIPAAWVAVGQVVAVA